MDAADKILGRDDGNLPRDWASRINGGTPVDESAPVNGGARARTTGKKFDERGRPIGVSYRQRASGEDDHKNVFDRARKQEPTPEAIKDMTPRQRWDAARGKETV